MKWIVLLSSLAIAIPATAAQDEPAPRTDGGVIVQETLKPGLCAKYYNFTHELKKFPEDLISGQNPQVCRLDPQINFESKDGHGFGSLEWQTYFAAVWTGVLRAPKEGKYTLYLKSDDGSKLFLDGKLLIDNDGKHRMDEDSKTVELTIGDHDLKVEYFQNKDKAGCVLSWKHEGVDKQVIPASAFWHPYQKDLDAK
jgi:hypothetical protein